MDILKHIDELVASKTFNLDALEGIKKIKDELINVQTRNDELKQDVTTYKKLLYDLEQTNNARELEIKGLKTKIESMEKTVEEGKQAIYTAQKHEAVAFAWKEAMHTVFKPNSVREHITRSVPIAMPAGGGSTGHVMHYGDTTDTIREDC